MTADELLKVVSERLNIEGLAFEGRQVAGITVNGMDVDFERDEYEMWLYVHGEVVKNALSLPKEKLVSLLKDHHLFNDVPNASFGISRDDALELFMRVPLMYGLTPDDWMAMFISFLVSLRDWRAKFGVGGDAEPEQDGQNGGESVSPQEESTPVGEMPFGFSGAIRV